MVQHKIAFVGSGNMATNLAHAFDKVGHTITQVISKNEENAKKLARKFGAYYGTRLESLDHADFIFLCVGDEQYAQISQDLPYGLRGVVCHTAGPVGIGVLQTPNREYGVFYPMQSVRKEELIDFLQVPIFIEGAAVATVRQLNGLADSISNVVKEVNSEDRNKYHLAAVFANNFTNLMYTLADDYLTANNLDFGYLLPLIKNTATRLEHGKPATWQTGPAKRGDQTVIQKHMHMLENEDVKELYEKLSQILMTKQ